MASGSAPLAGRALERERKRILDAAGFDDIEYNSGDLRSLPAPAHAKAGGLAPDDYEAQEEYYRRAGRFLHEHRFTSVLDREIWRLHCDGVGYREIAQQTGTYPLKVTQRMRELKRAMRVRAVRAVRASDEIISTVARMDWDLFCLVGPALIKKSRK